MAHLAEKISRLRVSGILASAALLVGACSTPTMLSPEIYLNSYAVRLPDSHKVNVCHGYECRLKTGVTIGQRDIERITRIMAAGSVDAASERAAIAKAIGWFENRVAPFAGTADDGGYRDLLNPGDAGQLDCIDEAVNSTGYLLFLREHDLLKHHTIGHPIAKGFLLDGRYPHVTAVVIENENGGQYAIDSWIFSNGDEPLVMLLDEWRSTSSQGMYRTRYPAED